MSHPRFPDVPSGYPFPALERELLGEWRASEIFEKSLAASRGKPPFVFYEGPPTANNKPHVGHVVTRVVKDLLPRFRTMQGFEVARKAGWDTHGLPVEIEVEKTLGFSGKQQIEEHGIAEFNQACLESVQTYERAWRVMTDRIGYWVDLDGAYKTYTNDYIESVWWALAQLSEKGLLDQGYKIQPYCARCGTTLSSHEVAQNYKDVDDPSVWALFPAREGQHLTTVEGDSWTVANGVHLVAWTTTPWTLLAHVALAVHPQLTYRLVRHPNPERAGTSLLFADDLDKPVPLELTLDGKRQRLDLRELPVEARFAGSELEGLVYDRPYPLGPFDVESPAPSGELERFARPPGATDDERWREQDEYGWRVIAADYVTTSDGTGIVHSAPPFGEDDYQAGYRYGLPLLMAVREDGMIDARATKFAGQWFKEADPEILRDLKERHLLLHSEPYRHSYPFCWRCDRPLLYYATSSWFVRTTKRKQELIERNREIQWHPRHVGEGRFGKWLENMVDWALSRSRYWGTPLPIWLCDNEGCSAQQVIGSYAELFAAAGRELPDDPYDSAQFDPHRPSIDQFTWDCAQCSGTMHRVEEVIDAWFDSGSMPFAQHHYPFENRELFAGTADGRAGQFPADFISEAVDQTRGWFYTLHVLGSLLFDSVAYRHCIVLGHVNDETGRKMSKRLGNVVDPMAVIEETGADALRWFFYVTNPEVSSRFSARLVRESAQNFILPLWNALSFFTIYANLDGWRPEAAAPRPFDDRPALDRWVLLRLGRLVRETTDHLEGYRLCDAACGIEKFVDDLTNWYIRRSRDRFWAGNEDEAADKESGYQAFYEVLTTLSRLLAPFTPFLADVLHRQLERGHRPEAAESVHLESWPQPPAERSDDALEAGMAAAQRIVRLGHAARNSHALKTRQPLAAVTLVTADETIQRVVEPYAELVLEELNVRQLRWAEERAEYVHHEIKPNYPKCGPRFGKRMKEVAAALAAADGDQLATELESHGKITLQLADGAEELSSEEVVMRLIEREGTATQGDRELLVALDTALSPELIDEGRAREVVHRISNARKLARLDYADRIVVRYSADAELERAIDSFRTWIAGETLAVELTPVIDDDSLTSEPVEEMAFALAIEPVRG